MKTIKLISWNVNGLRAVYKKGFPEWLTREKPHMLCIQETKASAEQLPFDLREIDGYFSFFSSAVRKGYSGVALYTQDKPEQVRYGFGIDKFDSEGRTIIADYGKFVLCNIYFPNGKMSKDRLLYKLEFYEAFLSYVDALSAQGKNIVICGDVNTAHREIDLARPKENASISGFLPEERAWIDKLVQHGYIDTFRMFSREPGQYTWWDLKSRARERNIGWRIDYFFINETMKKDVKASYMLTDVMGSDHCPIGLDITVASGT